MGLKNPNLKKVILDLNRIEQLFNYGEDSLGKSLGEYSAKTIEGTPQYRGKIEKGQPTDRITLKDTGDFYNSFDIKIIEDGFEIIAGENIWYAEDLFYDFGEEILGLNPDNLEEAIQYIRGYIVSKIDKDFIL
jgi:hypothetical protein